jgi:hypothetical protein
LYILPFSLYSSHLLLMLNILSGEAKTWFSIFMDKDVILAVTISINIAIPVLMAQKSIIFTDVFI